MTKFLIIAGLIVAVVVIFMRMGSETPNNDGKIMAQVELKTQNNRQAALTAYHDAPQAVRDVAVKIFTGQPLDLAELTAIRPELLNGFFLSFDGSKNSNLLFDAVGSNDLDAATKLVEAGVDVNLADGLLGFRALSLYNGSRHVPFPDFRPGMPFIKLYAENGGNLGVSSIYKPSNLLNRAAGLDNLEGLLYLLEQGADGWTGVLHDGFRQRSYFDLAAITSANSQSAEILFRIAKAGHFKTASPKQMDILLATLEGMLTDGLGRTGPRESGIQWRLQHVTQALIENSPAQPSKAMLDLLATPVNDSYGGWQLEPRQVRSPEGTEPGPLVPGKFLWPKGRK